MATDIDVRTISNFSSLPETTISGLLDAPTVDTIKSFLQSIQKSARECEQSKSQKLKLEVELETVVRTNESKVKVLQSSRDKALAEVQKLRSEVQTAENNRAKAESDLEQLRSSNSSEASENSSLRSRISSLEASNRDVVTLLESKTNSYEKLSQDLSAQHQKAVELRKQVTTLEQSIQSSNSSVSSSKFREQSLQLEIDQLKKSNEWLQNERTIKAEEHTSFRKEKNARLTELSRLNEQYISDAEALKRSEAALKHRVEELSNRHEDMVQENQKLQEEKHAEADAFRSELEATNRLANLRQNQAETAQERVTELQNDLDELKDETAEELGRLRAEAQNDHEDKEAAERKIDELETTVTKLQSDLEQALVRPSTPRQTVNTNGTSTPMRPSTPLGIFSPSSSSRLKGQPSVTQMFTEYKKLEKELASEKRNNEELQNSLDVMVQELESSKPELDEARSDYSRLQTELLEMSSLVEQANRERDQSAKEVRACHGQLQARTKEIEVLSQQLRDAGSEIRYLLMEQHVRDNGDAMTREDFDEMQRASDEAMSRETANLSETQQVVNQKLIVFKSISDLQEQNENQLKTIRNLVANLESNESQERQQKFTTMETELRDAQSHIANLQLEIKTMLTHSKSFSKEREMFRNMLKRGGLSTGQVTDFSRSLPGPPGGVSNQEFNQSSMSGNGTEFAKALKDMQDTFESHRQEFNANATMLRAQVDDLTKRNSQVQTEASRSLGQLSAANQRYEMLRANFNMLKNENVELQKRSYSTSEDAAKQAVKVQQVGEELVEARGMLDSLRRESANLKAEKDLWKNVEKRLIEDNESLRNDRGRLDQLNGSLQALLNEREQTDSEQRRRLQAQAESLETELQTAKRKLNDEVEENKKTVLRREYEQEQAQKRIDDLMTSLSSIREELASAKTSKDHLQARVDELTVGLRSAEERLEVYTKPTVEPETNGAHDGLAKEEELTIRVSELKRDLELKASELDRANEQIETYKSIAQDAEEQLQQTNETADLYRENTEESIAAKDAKIKDLEQRVEDISSELSTTNSELSKLRDAHSGSDRRLEEQKAQFEAEIERLKEQEERSTEQAQFNLEASKAQAEIATQAQQNYENEIVKNAEAIKSAQAARSEANQLRLEMVDLKTQADTAQTNLQQKESSWSDMKLRYDQEITDLKHRREEIAKQNAILHGQLENFTQQITSLQRDRADLAAGESVDTTGASLESHQELIKFLRREKEIVDVQYHLSKMEENRLRQQLTFAQSQLDDTRLKLDQQLRTEADSARNATSHNKLMDTLNELNLFRESSVTLRAEARQAAQALSEKTEQVERLEAQLHPLQARISELENVAELRDGETKLLQEDRDHWRQRTQNILSKYDRVDPAEIDSMKERLTELEKERDEAVSARDALQSQVDGISEQVEAAKTDLRNRLSEQFKARNKDMTGKLRDKQTEVDKLTAEKVNLQKELDVVREQLESAHNHTTSSGQVNGEVAKSPGEIDDDAAEVDSRIATLQSSIQQKDEEISALKAEVVDKVKAKQDEMRQILNKRLSEVKQDLEKAKETALAELESKLKAKHQEELETLRAQSVPVSAELQKSTQPQNGGDNAGPLAEEPSDEALLRLSDTKAKFLLENHAMYKRLLVSNVNKKVAQQLQAELAKAHDEGEAPPQVQELESRFAAEKAILIQEKASEFAAQKEQMEKDFETRLATEKQELIAEQEAELASQKQMFSAESERKIQEQVSRAEQMAAQKSKVQLNIANNRANQATAKLEIVKLAAAETPTKAVSEVWEVASKAKAAPVAQPAQPTAASAALPSTPTSNQTNTAATTNSVSATTSSEATEIAKSATEEPKSESTEPAIPNGPAKPAPSNAPNAVRQASSLPQPGRGGTTIRGRGGIPQSAGRGTSIPRAGGNVRGRGGRVSSVGANVPNAPGGRGGGAQNPRTSLNPSASQFIPGGPGAGAKRAREEGEGGDGGQGKRIRGGGAGS